MGRMFALQLMQPLTAGRPRRAALPAHPTRRRISDSNQAALRSGREGLRVSEPGDRDELEADRIADAVLGSAWPAAGDPSGDVPFRPSSPTRDDALFRRAAAQSPAPSEPIPGGAEPAACLGAGSPLPAAVRAYFEPRFGRDLGHVRLHTGAAAAEMARSLRAKAFAFRSDIVFAAGSYDPDSAAGRRLLAHELAHVGQGGPDLRRQVDEDETEEKPKVRGPRPTSLFSMDYSSVCGGGPCFTDEQIYAGLERSRAEDAEAEARAAELRMMRGIIRQGLETLVALEQRGTRQHRYALERLETFKATGHLPPPRINMEGPPAPVTRAAPHVMLGLATGGATAALSAVEAITGESLGAINPHRLIEGDFEVGRNLSRGERIVAGVGALAGLVGGRIGPLAGSSARVVSPVFRYGPRDIVIVETSVGRQAFYRSTGQNSGQPGAWLPVDEVIKVELLGAGGAKKVVENWFNKWEYTVNFPKGHPLHRLGSQEFKDISESLGRMKLGAGAPLQSKEHVNAILDFFNARITQYTRARPGPQ